MLTSQLRSMARQIGHRVPPSVRTWFRPLARTVGIAAPPGSWWRALQSPWDRLDTLPDTPAVCNICGWGGSSFGGVSHCESAECPQCNSVARDRFLLWCFTARVVPSGRDLRVVETSPRLDERYRQYLRSWFDYRTSDFDQSSHVGDLVLDLQNIELPDQSIDVMLSPHVLEHVPDTGAALREIRRVLAPGGTLFLQIPLQHGRTHVPPEPSFHADNTPVMFNFGWDLTDMIRDAGFLVTVLVPEHFARQLAHDAALPEPGSDDFDVTSIFTDVPTDVTVVVDTRRSERLGFIPAHQFVTWECSVPAATV